MNNQLHNQIKQLSDRELLEGIYQMLLVVMQEQLISDSKQLGINVIADLLVDNMYRNRERNENNNNAPYLGQQSITIIFDMKKDGEYELPASTYSATYNMKWQVIAASYPHTCNITIEQIPAYPNALVTDGVDDYGVVENFKSLQNYMMFFQCAITRPNTTNGMFSTTPIESGIPGWMLLQGNSAYYVRFGNNVYKTFNVTSSIGNKISYVLSANNELMTCYVGEEKATQAGTYSQTGANMSLFLSDIIRKTRFGSMAFYKSILFDSVPTKETDGFTEQDLINYVLENLITK